MQEQNLQTSQLEIAADRVLWYMAIVLDYYLFQIRNGLGQIGLGKGRGKRTRLVKDSGYLGG